MKKVFLVHILVLIFFFGYSSLCFANKNIEELRYHCNELGRCISSIDKEIENLSVSMLDILEATYAKYHKYLSTSGNAIHTVEYRELVSLFESAIENCSDIKYQRDPETGLFTEALAFASKKIQWLHDKITPSIWNKLSKKKQDTVLKTSVTKLLDGVKWYFPKMSDYLTDDEIENIISQSVQEDAPRENLTYSLLEYFKKGLVRFGKTVIDKMIKKFAGDSSTKEELSQASSEVLINFKVCISKAKVPADLYTCLKKFISVAPQRVGREVLKLQRQSSFKKLVKSETKFKEISRQSDLVFNKCLKNQKMFNETDTNRNPTLEVRSCIYEAIIVAYDRSTEIAVSTQITDTQEKTKEKILFQLKTDKFKCPISITYNFNNAGKFKRNDLKKLQELEVGDFKNGLMECGQFLTLKAAEKIVGLKIWNNPNVQNFFKEEDSPQYLEYRKDISEKFEIPCTKRQVQEQLKPDTKMCENVISGGAALELIKRIMNDKLKSSIEELDFSFLKNKSKQNEINRIQKIASLSMNDCSQELKEKELTKMINLMKENKQKQSEVKKEMAPQLEKEIILCLSKVSATIAFELGGLTLDSKTSTNKTLVNYNYSLDKAKKKEFQTKVKKCVQKGVAKTKGLATSRTFIDKVIRKCSFETEKTATLFITLEIAARIIKSNIDDSRQADSFKKIASKTGNACFGKIQTPSKSSSEKVSACTNEVSRVLAMEIGNYKLVQLLPLMTVKPKDARETSKIFHEIGISNCLNKKEKTFYECSTKLEKDIKDKIKNHLKTRHPSKEYHKEVDQLLDTLFIISKAKNDNSKPFNVEASRKQIELMVDNVWLACEFNYKRCKSTLDEMSSNLSEKKSLLTSDQLVKEIEKSSFVRLAIEANVSNKLYVEMSTKIKDKVDNILTDKNLFKRLLKTAVWSVFGAIPAVIGGISNIVLGKKDSDNKWLKDRVISAWIDQELKKATSQEIMERLFESKAGEEILEKIQQKVIAGEDLSQISKDSTILGSISELVFSDTAEGGFVDHVASALLNPVLRVKSRDIMVNLPGRLFTGGHKKSDLRWPEVISKTKGGQKIRDILGKKIIIPMINGKLSESEMKKQQGKVSDRVLEGIREITSKRNK